MITKEQQKAIEEAANKFYPTEIYYPDFNVVSPVYDLSKRLAFFHGTKDVLKNPSKYGLQPINEWVSVKDRLPEEGDEYNVVIDIQDGLGVPVSSTIEWDAINKEWCYVGSDIRVDNVTYWQPLPHPPTDVEPK